MKFQKTAALVAALTFGSFSAVAFADPPPEITQEECQKYKHENEIMKGNPVCAAMLGQGGSGGSTPVPPTDNYVLLCQEGTTGQSGIHFETADKANGRVGGMHCTCAPNVDPVVRVTGDWAGGSGRVEVCLADVTARLSKAEGDISAHTTIINQITQKQVLDENAIAALQLDVDAINTKLADHEARLAALEGRVDDLDKRVGDLEKNKVSLYGYGGARLKFHGRYGFSAGGGATGGLVVMPSKHVGITFNGSISGMYELNDPEIADGGPLVPLEFSLGPAFVFNRFLLSPGLKVEQWNRLPHSAGGLEGNSIGWGVGFELDFMVELTRFMALKVDASIEGGRVWGAKDGKAFRETMPQGGGGVSIVFGKLDFLP